MEGFIIDALVGQNRSRVFIATKQVKRLTSIGHISHPLSTVEDADHLLSCALIFVALTRMFFYKYCMTKQAKEPGVSVAPASVSIY